MQKLTDAEMQEMIKAIRKTGVISIPETPSTIRYERSINEGEKYITETFEGTAEDILTLVRGIDKGEVTNKWDTTAMEMAQKDIQTFVPKFTPNEQQPSPPGFNAFNATMPQMKVKTF